MHPKTIPAHSRPTLPLHIPTQVNCHTIEVPPKLWRPKPKDRYQPDDINLDLDDGILLFTRHGNANPHPTPVFRHLPARDDIRLWDDTVDSHEFEKNFRLGSTVDLETKGQLTMLIQRHWDAFYEAGVVHCVLGYEFTLDTGKSQPVCCPQPNYGPHESKIIMQQLDTLLHNDWIRTCGGPWGSMVVLAPKPHQEHVEDINEFVWRMCVSYRKLNAVTLPFTYPIPRCDDSIHDLGDHNGPLFFMSLDARTGHHQIRVRDQDQEKLAFFAPNNRKYCFTVMPFGPRNAPSVYTAFMQILHSEWDALFRNLHPTAQTTICKIIIDDILLSSPSIPSLLAYLDSVLVVCTRYRLSLKLNKCDFLKDRVEFVGHDLTANGNHPAASKCDRITNWPLPTTGPLLHTIVSLCNFYHKFVPWLEVNLTRLRKLMRQHYRKAIPSAAWTPELLTDLATLKTAITSSPCLARYDSSKPVFLKTDWSKFGMGFILMQPEATPLANKACTKLLRTGVCDFDTVLQGPRLRPVWFGSRPCKSNEQSFHSFVGEISAARWGIKKCRKYLWGTHFYLVGDCSAMKEVLDYEGDITQVRRWAQELLGYHFSIIHRPARMMRDVDALNRQCQDPLIRQHHLRAAELHLQDAAERPWAYDPAHFPTSALKPNPTSAPAIDSPVPATFSLSVAHLHSAPLQFAIPHSPHLPPLPRPAVSCFHACAQPTTIDPDISSCCKSWLSVNPGFPTLAAHLRASNPLLSIRHLFLTPSLTAAALCAQLIPESTSAVGSVTHLHSAVLNPSKNPTSPATPDLPALPHRPSARFQQDPTQPPPPFPSCFLPPSSTLAGADFTYFGNGATHSGSCATHWLRQVCLLIATLHAHHDLSLFIIIVPLSSPIEPTSHLSNILRLFLPPFVWTLSSQSLVSSAFGDCVAAPRWIATGHLTLCPCSPAPLHPVDCEPEPSFSHVQITSYDIPTFTLPTLPLRPTHPPPSHDRLSPFVQCLLDDDFATPVYDPSNPIPEPLPTLPALSLPPLAITLPSSPSGLRGRHITWDELLHAYLRTSLPHSLPLPFTPYLLSLLRSSTPHHLCDSISEWASSLMLTPPAATDHDAITARHWWTTPTHKPPTPTTTLTPSAPLATQPCFAIRPFPDRRAWADAYQADPATALIIQHLESGEPWTPKILAKLPAQARQHAAAGRFITHNNRLCLVHQSGLQRHTLLIYAPEGLRQDIFSALHGNPTGGHFRLHPTRLRIKCRFFWPNQRTDVTNWVRCCAHCVAADKSHRHNSNLAFSWPISSPMFILHCDLWSPGEADDSPGEKLLACMCDLTQFVIGVSVTTITADQLAVDFFQNVLLKVGLCGMVVVDAGSTFAGVFQDMCSILGIRYHQAARGNHKAVSVERFFRYLNKAVTIATNDRNLRATMPSVSIAIYAWNACPIDGTEIVRSVPAIGREFKFPIDYQLLDADNEAFASLQSDPGSRVLEYIRQTHPSVDEATHILQCVIEDRREAHRLRTNTDKPTITYAPGDLVFARVSVQSDAKKNRVGKLSYATRGPFRITKADGHNAYDMVPCHKPNSTPVKYSTSQLSPVPAGLMPCQPVDACDLRFLNHTDAPKLHPLAHPLHIEFYNAVWFADDASKPPAAFDYSSQPDVLVEPSVSPFPTLHDMTSDPIALPAPADPDDDLPPFAITPSAASLRDSLPTSIDRLFFIQFTAAGTFRPRWFLVQATATPARIDPTLGPLYTCHFFLRHTDDKTASDPDCRYWPEWHFFTTDPVTGQIQLTDWMYLIPLGRSANPSKHLPWTEDLPLTSPSCHLLGPFDFAPPPNPRGFRHYVPRPIWLALHTLCQREGIIGPLLTAPDPSRRRAFTRRNTSRRSRPSGSRPSPAAAAPRPHSSTAAPKRSHPAHGPSLPPKRRSPRLASSPP